MKTIVVILAGGQGTRIRHLLPGLPKPLAPINGKPFLEWIIEFLVKQGLNDIVISTGYLADQIKNFVSNNLCVFAIDKHVMLRMIFGFLFHKVTCYRSKFVN